MKNILLIFLMYPWMLFSQGYSFNYKCIEFETHYIGDHKRSERTNYHYTNTKDSTIQALDYKFNTSRNLNIYDTKRKIFWKFDREKSIDDKPLSLIKSYKLKERDPFIVKLVTVEKITDLSYEVSVFGKNKIKPTLDLDIHLSESSFPLQKIQFLDASKEIHSKIYSALIKKLPSLHYQLKSVKSKSKLSALHSEFTCTEVDVFFDVSPFLK